MQTKTAIITITAFILSTAAAQAQSNTSASQQTNATAAIVNNTPGSGSTDLGDQVPPVYAPGLDSGTNDCAVSASAGGAFSGFGIALGASYENEDCQRRNWFVLQSRAGNAEVAKALACENPEVRKAYRLADEPCPQEKAQREQAMNNNGGEVPGYCDNGGGFANERTIRNNCPNAEQILK